MTANKKRKKRKSHSGWKGLALLLVILAVAAFLLATAKSFRLTQASVTLEAGSDFQPEDYIASVNSANISDITIDDPVNTGIPGTYYVIYRLGFLTKTLSVTIQDTEPPELACVREDNTVSLSADRPFVPQEHLIVGDATEVTLTSNATEQNLTVPGTYRVTVTATDAGGNRTELVLQVIVIPPDTDPPEIHGTGNIGLTVGDAFDPKSGVTVTDLTDPAPVLTVDTGDLDTSKIGSYTVTYTAWDASGNETVAERLVTVSGAVTVGADGTAVYTPGTGSYGWDVTGLPDQPYLVAVNLSCNTTTVYTKDADGYYTVPVKAIVNSVGREGHETPPGRFITKDRAVWGYMADGSWGRYFIRINGGILFHSVCYYTDKTNDLEYEEYNKLGSPASLGCVRMCVADAKWLYDNCPTGFPVVIYEDASFAGPLGKPTPIRIDTTNKTLRGWDPTDWDPASPWNQ